jgi:Ca-activated chloride channel homolog
MGMKMKLPVCAVAWLLCQIASAQVWYLSGRVEMEDGSPPPKPAGIERVCDGGTKVETLTDRQGRFVMQRVESGGIGDTFDTGSGTVGTGSNMFGGMFATHMKLMTNCMLRAALAGYDSTVIRLQDRRPTDDPHLPPFILKRHDSETMVPTVPRMAMSKDARSAWGNAVKAAAASNWAEAERYARQTAQAQPRFAQGWRLAGAAAMNQKRLPEAREALVKAIAADPKLLISYVLLARADLNMNDWEGAKKAAEALIKADTEQRFPEAYVYNAMARYQLHDLEGAEKSAREALRRDPKRRLPRAEYALGLILAAKRDYTGATKHLGQYLELEPQAGDAETVRSYMTNLGKPGAPMSELEPTPADLTLPPAGETWVPGGMKALAVAARIEQPLSPATFFADYCEALVRRGSPGSAQSLSGFQGALSDYFAAVNALVQAGERKGGKTVVTLSLATPEKRADAGKILPLLGWRTVAAEKGLSVEPGDSKLDGTRQPIPALLGIDELAMRDALEAGKSYTFEVLSESVRLIGGDGWSNIIRSDVALPGGLAEAFARDLRLAKVYTGLNRMGTDTATEVVKAVGLRTLALQHANLLWNRAEAFRMRNGAVALAGGPATAAIWTKLAGVNERDPAAFFRALFTRERGRLAAFYAMVAQADPAHQRFFTKDAATAARLFALFRNPYEVSRPGEAPKGSWPPSVLESLPVDGAGHLRYPGGRLAWTNSAAGDVEVLATLGLPDALNGVAKLEMERKAPLDIGSARLLARHWAEWRPLRPYFDRLPGLGAAEFEALEAFGTAVAAFEPAKRNLVLGEWHSLIELAALGTQAGGVDANLGARTFRQACQGLIKPDFSRRAVETLRQMTKPARNLDDAVPTGLLRLDGVRRAAFEQVKELQQVPSLEKARADEEVWAALAGQVYAAWLAPDGLLVSEDRGLLRRHRFATETAAFNEAELERSSSGTGSRFSGGFANFGELARKLVVGGGLVEAPPVETGAASAPAAVRTVEARTSSAGADFQADSRLVEVYATVTDARGRYVDGLSREKFVVLDEGKPQTVKAFESNSSSLSCALLLDVTGSMEAALPALKTAALKLIGELRAGDSVAVYSFSEEIIELQPFTTDKRAAQRAVLRPYPFGRTALYDSLTQVARAIAGRKGKKVILVFTDGADNLSSLTAEAAVRRAKLVGAPVYTIAQGSALRHVNLLKQLSGISTATGGLPFTIRQPNEIGAVFERVANDLKHGYLLAYQPPPAQGRTWRKIKVELGGAKSEKVRAREGYYSK